MGNKFELSRFNCTARQVDNYIVQCLRIGQHRAKAIEITAVVIARGMKKNLVAGILCGAYIGRTIHNDGEQIPVIVLVVVERRSI